MKKTYLFMVAAAFAMVVASCGQKSNNAKVEAAASEEVAVAVDSAAVVADSVATDTVVAE